MLRMHALARQLGVRAVFLTHPYRYGTGPEWASREGKELEIGGRKYRISAATERRLLDVFNAELLSLCASSGLECMDLAAGMDREAGRAPDTPFFYDEGHFNDAGAERAASLLADYLERSGAAGGG
jgi:lysophospholipase L1-like esterase